MPQLDVSTFTPQLVWLAISFIALYLLMSRLALPRVDAIIEARRKRMDDDLARAAAIKAEAEAVIAAYQRTLAEARAQAQAAVKERTDRFAAEAAEQQRQLAEALAEQTRAAEREIGAAKERAFAEIRNVAVDVARSVTEKLTGSAADEATLAPAVDRAMAERVG
ncbi:MAG TPA: F0F1 ATP synthase subunit B' [Stellaceae bacterium]|nr:F0F1 ATP synthase subunit B' [Stellaceae bacterium]